jgi:hypothetical protein
LPPGLLVCLQEERIGFDNQLSALERTLGSKQHDYEELLLLSGACGRIWLVIRCCIHEKGFSFGCRCGRWPRTGTTNELGAAYNHCTATAVR